MQLSLKELFLSCQHSEQRFDELFSRTSRTVFHVSRRYFLTTWDEDDIFQEARLVLYHMLQHFEYGENISDLDFERLFYGYYRRSLVHHYANQLRYEQAIKRDFRITVYTNELDSYQFQCSVEETALMRANWKEYCRYCLNAEECEWLVARLEGLTLKDCARRFHHGTRYMSQSFNQLHQRWDDSIK